ncbi:hypothetical protein [Metasolibacillus sp.]|uniref:hypothetical protein n=1 Tax=Metasolibacillus sp. TaxID=2703680 RepID=UPI0025F89BE2|nr:hypothetical protein [Metasolibacillus sp.]MCT6926185.1 hypothetical protein [Metasolibacillus sp.]MCT6942435.1 hypothetical protein [Metasolibacillus sp.]
MKKLRGKRRYFRRMWAQIKETGIDTSVESWYAFSHTHLDFWGHGISSGKLRREHMKGHLALLDKVIEQFEQSNRPYQAWAHFNEKHAEYDAVFMHTSNPYDEFPFKDEDAQETNELPALYRDLIDVTKYRVYVTGKADEIIYNIQVKGKGYPICN